MAKGKPGRPPLTGEQREAIRETIIEIAKDLFINEGYEHASMRKIAARAGFAPTKIYYYFKNKQEILRSFWDDISKDFWKYCMRNHNTSAAPEVQLKQYMLSFIHYWMENPKNFHLCIMINDYEDGLQENADLNVVEGIGKFLQALQVNCEALIQSNRSSINDAELAAQMLVTSAHGVVTSMYTIPEINWKEKDVLAETAVKTSLAGMLK